MCDLTIIKQPVTELFSLHDHLWGGGWARCWFPHTATGSSTVIKCLLWLADLAVVQALGLYQTLL